MSWYVDHIYGSKLQQKKKENSQNILSNLFLWRESNNESQHVCCLGKQQEVDRIETIVKYLHQMVHCGGGGGGDVACCDAAAAASASANFRASRAVRRSRRDLARSFRASA
jgi:hypothetical protein